jgi:phenylalanyl-tRNA synthetase beta chain
LQKTLNIIATTLAEMGGEIYQMVLNYEDKKIISPDLTPEKISISLENTNKLLGLNLKESDLPKLLGKMGYDYKNKKVLVPAWRTDVLHEVDIIEDIAIAYGYDNFKPEIPNISTNAEESKENKIISKISEILIGLGLIETSSYHLIKEREAEIMKLKYKIELEDSKTEYKLLRLDLLIPVLRTFSENKSRDYPQEIFEIGSVFSFDPTEETGIKENESLVIALSPANFTKIKQFLHYLFSLLGVEFEIKEFSNSYLIEGRAGEIKINKKSIGYIGEVHPEILRDWGIKMPVAVLEISLEEIFELLKN